MNRTFALLSLFTLGCQVPGFAPSVNVDVLALTLSGVTDVKYTLTVKGTDGAVLWSEQLSSAAYGTPGGDLTYIGPCDASGTGINTAELTVNELVPLAAAEWQNPGLMVQSFQCEANSDTQVAFNVTILRSADLGFADVSVDRNDIFCSAKFDCVNDDNTPIQLVHGPNGDRLPSAVAAVSCVDPEGGDLTLYANDFVVQCASGETYVIDPSGLGWQAFSTPGGLFLAQETFRGALLGVPGVGAYWNLALGFDPSATGGNRDCRLQGMFTAAPEPWAGGYAPPNHPILTWDVPLTDANGARTCGQHPLFGGNGVDATYLAQGAGFTHAFTAP